MTNLGFHNKSFTCVQCTVYTHYRYIGKFCTKYSYALKINGERVQVTYSYLIHIFYMIASSL